MIEGLKKAVVHQVRIHASSLITGGALLYWGGWFLGGLVLIGAMGTSYWLNRDSESTR